MQLVTAKMGFLQWAADFIQKKSEKDFERRGYLDLKNQTIEVLENLIAVNGMSFPSCYFYETKIICFVVPNWSSIPAIIYKQDFIESVR